MIWDFFRRFVFRAFFVILLTMKILLVNPPLLLDESRYLPRRPSYPFEHLGLGYLAAYLRREGFEVVIKDAYLSGQTPEEFYPELERENPEIIGFSATHGFITSAVSLVNRLRTGGFKGHINLGGYLPTFLSRQLLEDFPQLDSIIRGEGELSFAALARVITAGGYLSRVPGLAYRQGREILINPSGCLVNPLDTLPFPARDTLPLLRENQDYASVLTSRGCYGKCNFCSIRSFYGESSGPKWRGRSAENVGAEIAALAEGHGLSKFTFPDDNFIGPGRRGKARAFDLAKSLLQKGPKVSFSVLCRAGDVEAPLFAFLKAAGLKTVFVGFESGVNRALNSFGKMTDFSDNLRAASVIKQLGLKCYPGFIMFDPYTTLDEVRQNLEFVKKLEGDGDLIEIDDLFNSLQPFIGTQIHRQLEQEGRLYKKPSDLLAYDVLPGYLILDERVEQLREKARELRRNSARLTYLNFEKFYREHPDLAGEIDLQYKKFRGLSKIVREAEEQFLSQGVEILEKETSSAGKTGLGRLAQQVLREVNPKIKEYNAGLDNILLNRTQKQKYTYSF